MIFPKEWDREEFSRGDYADYEFVYAGFDLFRFPSNARLLSFDVRRFIEHLVRRWRGRIDGVFSNNEYFGALIAAAVAERLGLPGTPPAVVITAQHKYYARLEQRRIAPEAVPAFSAFPFDVRDPDEIGLPFPLYIKPVRATFSVLVRRIADFAELRRHLTFSWLEELIIRRLVKPFNDLMPLHTGFTIDAHHLIAEEPLCGQEVNIDGYMRDGRVTFLGLCDAVMFPGTDHQFERFVYPSRVPHPVQERMRALAERLLSGMGYRHGFFNLEMFWDPATDRLMLIELNPRLASQLAGLYRRVDGINPHRMLLELCTGSAPQASHAPTGCSIAASLVSRRFDGRPLEREPQPSDLAGVRQRFPDAAVMLYLKRGQALAREMKWLGSYRYAVVNLGGASEEVLNRRYAEIQKMLQLT
ncbi:MAG: ATP-grasp domain-containing protein [Pseudomonadota bacterium]